MSPGAPRDKWSARASAAASLAISLCFHLLVLSVLAMAVHPFDLPSPDRPIDIELLPPLIPPKPVELKREPRPIPLKRDELVRPSPPILPKLVEVKRPPTPVPPRTSEIQHPPEPLPPEPAPPAPLEVARPQQPVLARPLEVPQRSSTAAPRALVTDRPAPPTPVAPAPSQPVQAQAAPSPPAVSQTPAALPVLTSEQVVQAPVEIKPPARPGPRSLNTVAATPQGLPPDGGGGGSPGGGTPGAPGSTPGAAARNLNGRILGFDNGAGLRMRLGCLNPDTYHLSPTERAECLTRLGAEAQNAGRMGPNIPEDKQAGYDRGVACHATTRNTGGALPRSSGGGTASVGTINGLGDNPRLRDCGPGER